MKCLTFAYHRKLLGISIPVIDDIIDGLSFGAYDAAEEGIRDLLGYGANDIADHNAETNYNYSLALQNDAQDFQREQTEVQNAFTEKMWNKTNEYNSAQAQVERMRAAGINPLSSSMSSSSAQSVGSSSSGSPTASVHGSAASLGHSVGTLYQARLQASQAKNLDVDTRLKEMLGEQEGLARIANLYSQAKKNDWDTKLTSALEKKTFQEIDNLRVSNEGISLDNINKSIQNEYLPYKLQAEISKCVSEGQLNYQKIDDLKNQMRNRDAETRIKAQSVLIQQALAQSQISLNSSQESLNYANKQESYARTNLTYRNCEEVSKRIESLNVQINGNKITNERAQKELDMFLVRYNDTMNLPEGSLRSLNELCSHLLHNAKMPSFGFISK